MEGGGEVLRGVVLADSFEEAGRRDGYPLGQHSADGVEELVVIVARTGEAVAGEAATDVAGEGDREGEVLLGLRGQTHAGDEGVWGAGAGLASERGVAQGHW